MAELLEPGLREISRLLRRASGRLRLIRERRKLARLETALGLLGWQQADYDSATQQHADRINDYERAQSRLSNESAAQATAIREAEEERAESQRIFNEEKSRQEVFQIKLSKDSGERTQAVTKVRAEIKEVEERIAVIEREGKSLELRYQGLLAKGSQAPEAKEEILELRRHILALPDEKIDWGRKRVRFQEDLSQMEVEASEVQASLAEVVKATRELTVKFEKDDAALAKKIAGLQKEKTRTEKQIHDLEKAKSDPYREIGRALADNQVAPLNQPSALTDVLGQREHIAGEEKAIADSLAASATENREQLQKALLILGSLGLLVLFVIWFVFELVRYHR